MSVKTTHYTDRETAIKTIMRKISELSNKELEKVLEDTLDAAHNGECFMNFYILDEDYLTDDHQPRFYGE